VPAGELADHAGGDGGRQEPVAHGDGPDARDELLGRLVLEHEPAGAGVQRLVDVLVEVERREHEHPRVGPLDEDPARRLQAVELRHADVHEHEIGLDAQRPA